MRAKNGRVEQNIFKFYQFLDRSVEEFETVEELELGVEITRGVPKCK